MTILIANDQATIASLIDRLMLAESHVDYQRILCVFIRARPSSKASEIAELLVRLTATVHVIYSRYAKKGDSKFDLTGCGRRQNQHMTTQRDAQLLAQFREMAKAVGLIPIIEI